MSAEVQDLPEWLSVSRETHCRLKTLLELVARWNPRINLVSAGSLNHGWSRHILDSAQLWIVAGATEGGWLDIGSGGGFPGLVIAILADELAPSVPVTLVESDRRKCVFLTETARQLGVRVGVRRERVESMEAMAAAVVSARALAPLNSLLHNASRHLASGGVALFPKGQSFRSELALARDHWQFNCEAIKSLTDPNAVVLRIENIEHV
jgi:16S rRNA (guanine527-N7)-methyltransferase